MHPPLRRLCRALTLVAPLALTLALALASSTAAAAPINVEKDRQSPQEDGWSANLQSRLGFKSGNVNLLDVGVRGRLAFRRDRHLVFGLVESRFASRTKIKDGGTLSDVGSREATFLNRHMGHLRYNVEVAGPLIAEAFGQAELDQVLLLRRRFLMGVGPRFVLFDNPDFGAYLGTAYMAEREELDDIRFIGQPGGGPAANWWHRWSSYLSLQLQAADNVKLRNIVYAQPRLDAFGDLRLLNEFQFEVSITERLSTKIIGFIGHDTRPPTVCADALGDTGCPDGSAYRLIRTDTGIEHALSFEF